MASSEKQLRLLDLGCGSGILAQALAQMIRTPIKYVGIDLSDVAIERAKERRLGESFDFTCAAVETVVLPGCDIGILLGLTDWIEETALRSLLSRIHATHLLISYTSRARGARRWIYDSYRKRNDKHAFSARSYDDDEFIVLVRGLGWDVERDLTTSTMRPGRLLCLRRTISI